MSEIYQSSTGNGAFFINAFFLLILNKLVVLCYILNINILNS